MMAGPRLAEREDLEFLFARDDWASAISRATEYSRQTRTRTVVAWSAPTGDWMICTYLPRRRA